VFALLMESADAQRGRRRRRRRRARPRTITKRKECLNYFTKNPLLLAFNSGRFERTSGCEDENCQGSLSSSKQLVSGSFLI